jgi:hypothetical protein
VFSKLFLLAIKNSPYVQEEFFSLWRLGETTTPDNTWAVGVVISFSDYKSDYLPFLFKAFILQQ